MPGMELAQTKIPYLPPDWTVARGVRYAAKLGLFLLVPGLHQIACRRWILGGLIFAIFAISRFIITNSPIGGMLDFEPSFDLHYRLTDDMQFVTWLLLAADLRNLEGRRTGIVSLLLLQCFAVIYFAPFDNNRAPFFHIEQADIACPAFCKHDIVEWEVHEPDIHRISRGDYVVLEDLEAGAFRITKILAGPVKEACAGDSRTSLGLPPENEYCKLVKIGAWEREPLVNNSWQIYWGEYYYYRYDFLIPGRPKRSSSNIRSRNLSLLSRYAIIGVRPRKIGNIREYFFYSDELTDVIGHAVLTIHQWTGVNLFGLSETR
jgi:hypothetical protein